ncbi:hypothetical protein DACRYDRAFT_25182 [Dacryopinax primogenitus]|uniref:Uncharacterized protein n=1 Tax=Dacryopinax primogenitus (strain DJM 731) TaxID=1858805 RepID=M5FR98_DACPD|nr:uncharacterized protein DACRYDRAFT_25182 [Dacryopinax primogenitus]EJT97449.1 hypothetical protein DACRYDRAFT_25182 [Dacryopinax primogenitus]
MWLAWFLQLSAGVVLCLLGFLGVGNQFQNPAQEETLLVYKLLHLSWLSASCFLPCTFSLWGFALLRFRALGLGIGELMGGQDTERILVPEDREMDGAAYGPDTTSFAEGG